MSTKLNVIFIFLVISSLISLAYSQTCNSSQNLSCWCRELPYPSQCLAHLSHKMLGPYVINGKRDFLRLTLKAALTEVLRVGKSVKTSDGAFPDCSNIYDLAAHQLTNTLDDSSNHTDSDTQTWLSAVSTNILICEREVYRTSSGNQLTPLLNNNITALIRNSLTINHQWSENAVDYNIQQHSLNKLARGNKRKWRQPINFKPDIVVAKDGSGNYRSINEAVTALIGWTREEGRKYVIYIKPGVYYENILIPATLKNVEMVGDAYQNTIISRDSSAPKVFSLVNSATFVVYGSGFFAQGITFSNEVGGGNGGPQVAMASLSDQSVFYRCSFIGYQDTLYAASGRQFYRECLIRGTIDFIFGNAAAVFQKCTIRTANRGLSVITAQGREFPYDNTGFSFQYSLILPSNNTFLGRPWREYSRVAFIESYFNRKINPVGWLKFSNTSDVSKVSYSEYKNTGPGSSTRKRVDWKGYIKAMDYKLAEDYTVSKLIDGWSWLPKTGVSYDPWL